MTDGERKVYLCRRYRFAASHRLHCGTLSDEQNWTTYGKCNNPHGHGHNYIVEVCFSGAVHAETGMVTNLADLDQYAQAHVLDRFAMSNLNMDEAFDATVPTTENLLLEMERIFRDYPRARLEHVRIEETSNNSFATVSSAGQSAKPREQR